MTSDPSSLPNGTIGMRDIDTGVLDTDTVEALHTVVGEHARLHHCPTVAFGVVADGSLCTSGAYVDDRLDVRPHVDQRTVYRIASMTKSFSAAATLWLRDAGALRLDDPIHHHDPSLERLRSPTTDAAPITIRDLLAMSSGLVTDDPWADRHLDLTDAEFDHIVADGCVFAEPTGNAYEYSNFGFAVLGRVVQRASGRRIQDVVSEELLGPLGMHDSTWSQPADRQSMPPLRWLDDRFVEEIDTPGDGLIAPMGGIWTTVTDLARWVAWLDDAFPARDGHERGPLSRASRREMQTIQRFVGTRTLRGITAPSGYGYGLRVTQEPELGPQVFHSGGFPGYGSSMRWLPGRRLGVIALSNVTYAPMTELCARLLDTLHEHAVVPSAERAVTPALMQAGMRLVALLNAWDDSVAVDLFTDNVASDDAYERRRAAAAALAPIVLDRVEAVNDGRGRARCTTADGVDVTVTFALAPLRPIRIQEYEIVTA